MALREPQKNLKRWGEQKWRTKSGKPSAETGERYLPERAIKMLSSAKYAAGTRRKRKATAKGEQRAPYTKAEKSAFIRATGKKYKARKKK
jgi:hypothetical protein|tara:strand:- start:673 stop:942 length:270 start_codon:yes stop_codon:yes gene_type:complete